MFLQVTTRGIPVQAIALGADTVMVGRPILYGLALQGEDKVRMFCRFVSGHSLCTCSGNGTGSRRSDAWQTNPVWSSTARGGWSEACFADLSVTNYYVSVQAIALGADAVMVGRPILYGLALQGENGVRHVLQMLRRELCLAMQLAGCTSLKAITPSLVIPFGQNAFITSSKL